MDYWKKNETRMTSCILKQKKKEKRWGEGQPVI